MIPAIMHQKNLVVSGEARAKDLQDGAKNLTVGVLQINLIVFLIGQICSVHGQPLDGVRKKIVSCLKVKIHVSI